MVLWRLHATGPAPVAPELGAKLEVGAPRNELSQQLHTVFPVGCFRGLFRQSRRTPCRGDTFSQFRERRETHVVAHVRADVVICRRCTQSSRKEGVQGTSRSALGQLTPVVRQEARFSAAELPQFQQSSKRPRHS